MAGLEPATRQFWKLLFWPLNYIPMKLKTARWEVPCERLLVRAF